MTLEGEGTIHPASRTSQPGAQTQTPSHQERMREQGEKVRDDVREMGRTARAAAEDKMTEMRMRGEEALEAGRDKMREAEDQVVAYVREQPLKSMLIAAGVGALFGVLIRR